MSDSYFKRLLAVLALAIALAFLATSCHAASFPYITLNKQTNHVSDNGTALTFNGTPIGATGANPTATIGNTAVNGSAATFLRSDGAPAISTTATLQLGRLGLGLAPDGTSLLKLASTGTLSWDNGSGTADVLLQRDAANTLALRNGANAQAFNIYNTYTDASNYERGFMRWNANVFEMGREFAGTGANRDVRIRGQFIYLNSNGTDVLTIGSQITAAGNLIFGTDNTYDIGASGANRPRSVYVGTKIATGGFLGGVKTTATNYTAAVSDRTILVNGTTLTITLPTAVGATGQEYIVKVIAASTATVATTSSQNIDAATTYSLSAQYKYVKVQSDGTQWWIVANN